jgi:tRNA pseudouridine13 synthase
MHVHKWPANGIRPLHEIVPGSTSMADDQIPASDPTTPIYLTAELPGIGGQLKVDFDDFCVEEIPLYEPSGAGEHTFFQIEKRGVSTFRAVNEIARALGINPARIGYAGLKDAHAVARQTLSVDGLDPASLLSLQLPSIAVLWARRHANKLRIGHLAGNRFTVRVRGVEESALPMALDALAVLRQRGVPNHFGPQRFGKRGDTHALGRALLHDDASAFMRVFLGSPVPSENPPIQEARRLFDSGQYRDALAVWPRQLSEERPALEIIARKGASPDTFVHAMHAVSRRMRGFYVSAYQSYLFNQVVRARLHTLDRLLAGDVATKHDSGGSFVVQDPAVEQPRADRFEISPSGPIYGYKLLMAEGEPGQMERQVLEAEGLTLEDFKSLEALKVRGERRPLRFPLQDVELWYDGGVVLRFALPAGSYATNVLGEVMKAPVAGLDE